MTQMTPRTATTRARLFLLCRPAAIARFVVSVAVDTIKRHRLIRALAHVGKEVFKRIPSGADLNALLEVVGALGVFTTSSHREPRLIGSAFPVPVFGDEVMRPFREGLPARYTTATNGGAAPHVRSPHGGLLAALAATDPSGVSVLGRCGRNCCQHSCLLADHVRFLHESIISCNWTGPQVRPRL